MEGGQSRAGKRGAGRTRPALAGPCGCGAAAQSEGKLRVPITHRHQDHLAGLGVTPIPGAASCSLICQGPCILTTVTLGTWAPQSQVFSLEVSKDSKPGLDPGPWL